MKESVAFFGNISGEGLDRKFAETTEGEGCGGFGVACVSSRKDLGLSACFMTMMGRKRRFELNLLLERVDNCLW